MALLDVSGLNTKLQGLAKRVSVEALPEVANTLKEVSKDFKAFDRTEHGKILGELKGGFKGLTQEIDNAVDALNSVDKATVTRLDETAQGALKSLKTSLANEAGNISALVSSAHGSAISELMPAAKQFAAAAPGLVDDIISDGAPEAIASVLTKVKGEKLSDISGLLKQVADPEVLDKVESACNKLLKSPALGDLATEMTGALGQVETSLRTALGGLNAGNLLKEANELFTQNISAQIGSLTAVVGLKGLPNITSDIISGNIEKAVGSVIKSISIPPVLELELKGLNIDLRKTVDTKQMLSQLNGLKNVPALSTAAKTALEGFQNTIDKVDTDLRNIDTSIAANVDAGPPTSNPVVDPAQYGKSSQDYGDIASAGSITPGSSDGNFPFLNSKEEIVKYLQSATREITTVVWHWTANYTDQGYIGSEQIDEIHRARGWAGIGYHFIVKRDGSIQVGRDINKTGAHVGGFNTRSIGISFVAGYKCTSDKYRGIPPHSEVGPESITQAQHKAFKAFMSAWYTAFPGGQAWGHVDFPRNSGKVDPGFDVAKRVYEMFGKRNVGHPRKDDRILTKAEINQKRSIA